MSERSEPGCGGCVERERMLATAERRRRRATVRATVALGVGVVSAGGVVAVLLTGGNTQLEGLLGGLALAGPAFALVTWSHRRDIGGTVDEEERHAPLPGDEDAGPRPGASRRGVLVALAATAVAVATGTVATRDSAAERALRRTRWRAGARLVTSEGTPVTVDDLTVGGLQAVWPEGAVGAADSQAVLIRLEPDRMIAQEGRENWAPEGFVCYSRLCTHMGCPVSLYQQDPDILLCPCHQAAFDVRDGARAIHGPASRALPQLPIEIGADGVLRARDDFPDAVGASFWSRPR